MKIADGVGNTWNVHTGIMTAPDRRRDVHIVTARQAVATVGVQSYAWRPQDVLPATDVDWSVEGSSGDVLLWRYAD